MVLAAVLGIVLIVAGITRSKHNQAWRGGVIVGVVLLLVAVWLALPR